MQGPFYIEENLELLHIAAVVFAAVQFVVVDACQLAAAYSKPMGTFVGGEEDLIVSSA